MKKSEWLIVLALLMVIAGGILYLNRDSVFKSEAEREHDITYVVTGTGPSVIFYNDEFGNNSEERPTIYKFEKINWKKEFRYIPSKNKAGGAFTLSAFTVQEFPAHIRAEIYVDNKLVADSTSEFLKEGDDVPDVSIGYQLKGRF